MPQFLLATLVGRATRYLINASYCDALHVPTWMLVTVIFGTAAVVIGSRLIRGVPLLAETAPPVDDPRSEA